MVSVRSAGGAIAFGLSFLGIEGQDDQYADEGRDGTDRKSSAAPSGQARRARARSHSARDPAGGGGGADI